MGNEEKKKKKGERKRARKAAENKWMLSCHHSPSKVWYTGIYRIMKVRDLDHSLALHNPPSSRGNYLLSV